MATPTITCCPRLNGPANSCVPTSSPRPTRIEIGTGRASLASPQTRAGVPVESGPGPVINRQIRTIGCIHRDLGGINVNNMKGKFAHDPDHWERLAAAAGVQAEQMPEGERKRLMLRIARGYDELVDQAKECQSMTPPS